MSGGANVSCGGTDDPNDGGFALVMVLLFLLTVTALIAPLVLGARTELLVSANKLRQDRFEMVAEGILTVLARELASPPIESRSPGLSVRSAPLRCRTGSLDIETRIQDQNGVIGLNTASVDLLEAGFVALDFDRTEASRLASAVVAFRMPPDAEGERPRVDPNLVTAGLKEGPFEAIEELYDFLTLRRMPAQAIAETFTIHNQGETILGPAMSQRLSRILPAAPTPRYPFIAEAAEDGPKTYRIDVSVGISDMSTSGFTGAIVRASENETGDFELLERVTNPDFLPGDETAFSGAVDCDRLFGVGVAAFLATIPG